MFWSAFLVAVATANCAQANAVPQLFGLNSFVTPPPFPPLFNPIQFVQQFQDQFQHGFQAGNGQFPQGVQAGGGNFFNIPSNGVGFSTFTTTNGGGIVQTTNTDKLGSGGIHSFIVTSNTPPGQPTEVKEVIYNNGNITETHYVIPRP